MTKKGKERKVEEKEKKIEIVIVGVGGVGSALLPKIARFCQYLRGFATHITVVDGDQYEAKNAERQVFSRYGAKADVAVADAIRCGFDRVTFTVVHEYLTPENIEFWIESGAVVFLCVDNHRTRKTVDTFVSGLSDVVLINGGNELTDGNVQVYTRSAGEDVTASLSAVHPEIADPTDKSPHQMSCEELARVSSPQLFFANDIVSTLMCGVFYQVVQHWGNFKEIVRIGEVYFDLEEMRVNPMPRPARGQPSTQSGSAQVGEERSE